MQLIQSTFQLSCRPSRTDALPSLWIGGHRSVWGIESHCTVKPDFPDVLNLSSTFLSGAFLLARQTVKVESAQFHLANQDYHCRQL